MSSSSSLLLHVTCTISLYSTAFAIHSIIYIVHSSLKITNRSFPHAAMEQAFSYSSCSLSARSIIITHAELPRRGRLWSSTGCWHFGGVSTLVLKQTLIYSVFPTIAIYSVVLGLISDFVYNWLNTFFQSHSRSTRFGSRSRRGSRNHDHYGRGTVWYMDQLYNRVSTHVVMTFSCHQTTPDTRVDELARDAFVRTNRRAILPWCSSVCLSVWDGRSLWSKSAL